MKEFFSVLEIADILKISRSAVLYNIKAGKLKATRVGKIYIVTREDFGEFMKDQKEKKRRFGNNQTSLDF